MLASSLLLVATHLLLYFHFSLLYSDRCQCKPLLAVAMACDWQITRLRGDEDSYGTPVTNLQLTPKAEDGKPTT